MNLQHIFWESLNLLLVKAGCAMTFWAKHFSLLFLSSSAITSHFGECIFFVSYLLSTIKALPNILLHKFQEHSLNLHKWYPGDSYMYYLLLESCNFHCMYKFYKVPWTQAPYINPLLSYQDLTIECISLSLLYLFFLRLCCWITVYHSQAHLRTHTRKNCVTLWRNS